MKSVTLSADEAPIEAARNPARAEHTTLNDAFRQGLPSFAHTDERLQRYEAAIAQVRGRLTMGSKLSRDELNER